MDRNLLTLCGAPQRKIFCSSLMLPPRGIFPKFCSIPFLICPSAPTITAKTSDFTPHFLEVSISRSLCFENVLLTFIEVFRLDTSISLQHQLAWPMITIYRLVRWQFLIRMYLHIPENWLRVSRTHSSGYTQPPYCTSLDSQFLQVQDSQIWYDLLFLHACCIFYTMDLCRPSQSVDM